MTRANPSVAEVRRSVREARERSSLTHDELWFGYFGLGGDATAEQVRSFLVDDGVLSREDVNTLVQALNEHFLDRGLGMPVPYQEP